MKPGGNLRRWSLRALAGLVAIALALAAALVWWAGQTNSFLRWSLARAVQAGDGALSVGEVRGTLLGGFRIESLRWSDAARDIELDGLQVRLRADSLLRGELHLGRLEAAQARLVLHAQEEPDELRVPESLALPLALRIDAFDIGRLAIFRASAVADGDAQPAPMERIDLRQISLAGGYRNARYRIRRFGVSSPWGEVRGNGSLGADAPYDLAVDLDVVPRLAVPARPSLQLPDIRVLADGTLSEFSVRAATLPPAAAELSDATRPAGAVLVTTRVRPFATTLPERIDPLDVQFDALEPARFGLPDLPALRLSGGAQLRPIAEDRFAGELRLTNTLAGSLADGRLPVHALQLGFEVDARQLSVHGLQAALPDEAHLLAGFRLDFAGRVYVESAQLRAAAGTIDARGSASLGAPWDVDLDGRLSALEPGGWLAMIRKAGLPDVRLPEGWRGRIDGTWSARGRAWPDPDLETRLALRSENFAGRPLAVNWRAGLSPSRVTDVSAAVDFGSLRARAGGALGHRADRLTVAVAGETLGEFDARAAGSVSLNAEVTGGWEHVPLSLRMRISAHSLVWQEDVRLASLVGNLELKDWVVPEWLPGRAAPAQAGSRRPSGSVDAQWQIRGLAVGGAGDPIDSLQIEWHGDAGDHAIGLALSEPLRAVTLRARGALAGPLPGQPQGSAWSWSGRLLQARAAQTVVRDEIFALDLAAPADLHIDGRGFSLAASDWRFGDVRPGGPGGWPAGFPDLAQDLSLRDPARLSLDALAWQDGTYVLRGQAVDVPLGAWTSRLAITEPDEVTAAARKELEALRIEARWDVRGDDPARPGGQLRVELPGATRSEEHGRISLDLDDGRIDGRVSLHIPTLAFIDRALGPAWNIAGQARFDGRIGGTVVAPRLEGALTGRSLALVQHELGWRMDGGVLRADFDGDRLILHELRLQSGDGSIRMNGALQLDGMHGDFDLVADRLTVPLGPGERLVVSGATTVASRQASLQWRGRLRVDEGLIELRGGEVPARPADVVILGDEPEPDRQAGAAQADGATSPDGEPAGLRVLAALELDLGRELRIRGSGADLRLAGSLTLGGSLPEDPLAHGTVRVATGTYTAWGQMLQITRGRVTFDGPIDNPVLDIVAMRRNQPVEAGVSITGTVLSPRVQLVSSPDVPDAEKLSWLVLGVGFDDAASGAQMAALQAAAATLLGSGGGSGGLTHALGLDVLTIRSASTGGGFNRDFGASFPGQASGIAPDAGSAGDVLAVGKRLGSRVMVTYEQGLHGVWNLFRIQYAITRRLSLQAQAGTDTALDLLYSFSFDWSDNRRRWRR